MRLNEDGYGVVALTDQQMPVLTRLPEPFRAAPETVAEYLARTFGERPLVLGPAGQTALPARPARLGISGGAVYDALIAVTAAAAGSRLCTLDRRTSGAVRWQSSCWAEPRAS